jgi:hypothetical protein
MIVDRLTKSTLFLLMKRTNPIDKLAILYVDEVVRFYEVLVIIISDQDPWFTLRLWSNLQHTMKTKLNLSTTLHP